MVWSEQVGTSIVLPSDRVDGDGRNYIVIGEDVPDEIADNFTAALVFRSGVYSGHGSTPQGVMAGFIFYALGISTSGNFEVVSYFFTTGSPMSDIFYKYRSTVLSIAAPKSVSSQPGFPNGPVLALGTDADYDSYTEGPATTVRINNTEKVATTLDLLSPWTNWDTNQYGYARAIRDQLDNVTLVGLCRYNLSSNPSGNVTMCILPAGFRPAVRQIFTVAMSGGSGTSPNARVDVLPTGEVLYVPNNSGTLGTNGYVTLSGICFDTILREG